MLLTNHNETIRLEENADKTIRKAIIKNLLKRIRIVKNVAITIPNMLLMNRKRTMRVERNVDQHGSHGKKHLKLSRLT